MKLYRLHPKVVPIGLAAIVDCGLAALAAFGFIGWGDPELLGLAVYAGALVVACWLIGTSYLNVALHAVVAILSTYIVVCWHEFVVSIPQALSCFVVIPLPLLVLAGRAAERRWPAEVDV